MQRRCEHLVIGITRAPGDRESPSPPPSPGVPGEGGWPQREPCALPDQYHLSMRALRGEVDAYTRPRTPVSRRVLASHDPFPAGGRQAHLHMLERMWPKTK